VGVGDPIGAENKANLLKAVRADGVIIKPDSTIVPLDRCYVADAARKTEPLIAATYTTANGTKTAYVFAFNRHKTPPTKVHFSSSELGLSGRVYVYDYFSSTGKELAQDASFSAPLARDASAFYILAPLWRSGIAFLGDRGKFVGTGKQRITAMQDERDKLKISLVFAASEKFAVLHGYSLTPPIITTTNGEHNELKYEPVSGHFSVGVKPDTNIPLDKSQPDPVRKMTVVFECRRNES